MLMVVTCKGKALNRDCVQDFWKISIEFIICNVMFPALKGQYHGRYHDFGQKITKFKLRTLC